VSFPSAVPGDSLLARRDMRAYWSERRPGQVVRDLRTSRWWLSWHTPKSCA